MEPRTPQDQFLIIATDGLWDVINYQEACDFIRDAVKTFGRKHIPNLLVEEAIRKKNAGDNVSVVIVFFDQ
jgi:serine/threonine protein phosphatase PrpC